MTPIPRTAALTLAAVLLIAAAQASSDSSLVQAQTPADAPRVRMALVGAWHVHTNGFLNRISQMNPGQVEWVAVWDQDAARGRQFAERLGVPYEADYEKVLNDPRVDAVMIEAETHLHKDLIIRAARAKKHVFTDKILTARVEDGLKIKDAIERSGIKFVISHESMPVGAYQFARRLVENGSLGDIVSVHFRRAHGMAKSNTLPASWWDPAVAGGGALIDLGVHGMGLLAYLAGAPVRVSASMRHRTKRAVEDTATIMVDFENGAIGTAHTNMVTNIQENLLEVVGTDGMLVVVGTDGKDTVYLNSRHIPERAKGMTVVAPSEYAADGKYPINKFVDFVRDRSNTAQYLAGTGLDMETALRVVAISEAAYESVRQGGRPQDVSGRTQAGQEE
jgi:predicted dehydrogenase